MLTRYYLFKSINFSLTLSIKTGSGSWNSSIDGLNNCTEYNLEYGLEVIIIVIISYLLLALLLLHQETVNTKWYRMKNRLKPQIIIINKVSLCLLLPPWVPITECGLKHLFYMSQTMIWGLDTEWYFSIFK